MLKKIISTLVAMTMLTGIFATSVFAEETVEMAAVEESAELPTDDLWVMPEGEAEELVLPEEQPEEQPVNEVEELAAEAEAVVAPEEPVEQQDEITAQTVDVAEAAEEVITSEVVEEQQAPTPTMEPDTEYDFAEGNEETEPTFTEDTYNEYMTINGQRVEVMEAYEELRDEYLSSGEWVESVVATDTGFSYGVLSANQKAVYDAFYTACTNVSDCKKASFAEGASPTLEDVKIGVVAVLYDHPEVFWTGGGYAYSYYTIGSQTYIMAVGLSSNKVTVRNADTLANMRAQFNSAAQAILANVNKNGSKGAIALSVHDALAQATTYDTAGMNSSQYMPHTAYNALVSHTAVCDGYSKAYSYLLKQCGINSCLLVSDSLNHAWSFVELGSGDYYETDITWNDVDNRLRHDYFDLTTSNMNAAHGGTRNTDDFSALMPTANGTTFSYANVAGNAGNSTGTSGESTSTVDENGIGGFVTRLYQVCLDRTPDDGGKASWINDLKSGKSNGVQAAFGFVFSSEFKNKNYNNKEYVTHLYNAFMGREPDTAGLNSWVAALNSGTGRIAVFNGFACSAEFTKICSSYGITRGEAVSADGDFGVSNSTPGASSGTQVAAFVTRLYEVCLNRKPDQAGLNDWVNKLSGHQVTGKSAAHGFVFSNEFKSKNYSNEEYVEHLYQAFMGRASDAAGKAYWVNKLNAGTTGEAVFNGFADSTEFANICATYGITRG